LQLTAKAPYVWSATCQICSA